MRFYHPCRRTMGLRDALTQGLMLLGVVWMSALTSSAAEINAEWIGIGYGDWADPQNWKDGIVPVNSLVDQYAIRLALPDPSPFTQSALSNPMVVSSLTLGNNLYVYDPTGFRTVEFDVLDSFDWIGGDLSGWAAEYQVYGDALFEGYTSKVLDRTCTLTLRGHSRWTQGNLAWMGYGQVTNAPGALLDISTGGTVGSMGSTDSADIYNEGTIHMNAPGQMARFYGAFHNTGSLEVEAGDLEFDWNYDGPGAIAVRTGARLLFSGPGYWQTVPQTGGGELVFSEYPQELVNDTVFSCFTRIAADFSGDGNLTLSNAIWVSGRMKGPGITIVPPGGSLTIQGQSAQLSRDLSNEGQISLGPGAWLYGWPNITCTNGPDGEIRLRSGSEFGLQYSPISLVNQGSITKEDSGLGDAGVCGSVQNQGLIRSISGKLRLGPGGQNLGQMEVFSPGQIEADTFDFSDSSVLTGDGLVSLLGLTTLRGTVGTNLDLITSGAITVATSNFYSLRTLQTDGWINFAQSAGAEARNRLLFGGSLYGGVLRSLQEAELSFRDPAQISGGSRLELSGQSGLVSGILSIQGTNSALVNLGTLQGLGSSEVDIYPGAALDNEGGWNISKQMGIFQAMVSDSRCRLNTSLPAAAPAVGAGPFHLAGPVRATAGKIEAGPGAELSLSDLLVTNASILLSQARLTVATNLSAFNAVFLLDDAEIECPAGLWRGSPTLMGQGTLQGSVVFQNLRLAATSNANRLVVNGSFSMAQSNGLFQTVPLPGAAGLVFPYLRVLGAVTLNSKFDLVAAFAPSATNLVAGPVTILEADGPVRGGFINVTNGATFSTATNGYRFEVFYGTNSPYGANKVVVANFGTAFDRWRMQRFTESGLQDARVSGPGADPDHNGLSNLTEFVLAFGGNSTNAAVLPSVLPGPDGFTTVHLRRLKDIGRLQVSIALSTDLRTWQETPLGASPPWLELHRAFDLGTCYDYTYLYAGTPKALFLRITVSGQF